MGYSTPVSRLTAATEALARAAPVLSVTVPVTLAVTWAITGEVRPASSSASGPTLDQLRSLLMLFSPRVLEKESSALTPGDLGHVPPKQPARTRSGLVKKL